MKNNKHCKSENRRAHQFNANHLHGRCCKTSSNSFMNIRIFLGLCVVLGAGFISVRAADTPAQAAARVALLQKMYELDNAQTPPPRVPVTPSGIVVKHRAIYADAANVTGTVSEKSGDSANLPDANNSGGCFCCCRTRCCRSCHVGPDAVVPHAVVPDTVAPAAEVPAAEFPQLRLQPGFNQQRHLQRPSQPRHPLRLNRQGPPATASPRQRNPTGQLDRLMERFRSIAQ